MCANSEKCELLNSHFSQKSQKSQSLKRYKSKDSGTSCTSHPSRRAVLR